MGVVALLLLSLLGTGIAAAQQVAEGEGEARDKVGIAEGFPQGEVVGEIATNEAIKVPIIIVYRGYGFALKADGTEFHTLRIHVVRVRHIEPIRIRELMEKNKSIEEIRGEIIEKGGAPFYRGYMQFAEEHYRLANIGVNKGGDNLTINADVLVQVQVPLQGSELQPSECAGIGNVGNISITVMDYERDMIGEGKLTMRGEGYLVLLNLFL